MGSMSPPIRRWTKKKKRRSRSSSPPVIVFPILFFVFSLILFCLLIYGLSACRWNWERFRIL